MYSVSSYKSLYSYLVEYYKYVLFRACVVNGEIVNKICNLLRMNKVYILLYFDILTGKPKKF